MDFSSIGIFGNLLSYVCRISATLQFLQTAYCSVFFLSIYFLKPFSFLCEMEGGEFFNVSTHCQLCPTLTYILHRVAAVQPGLGVL